MNRLIMGVALSFLAMLQAILPAWRAMGSANPPLLLGGVLYYALTRSNSQFFEAALLAGLLHDCLSPIPLGFSVVGFLLAAAVIHHFRDRVFAESLFTHMLLGAAGAFLMTFCLFLLLVGSGVRRGVPFRFAFDQALGMAILGLLVFPLVCSSLQRLERVLGTLPRRQA